MSFQSQVYKEISKDLFVGEKSRDSVDNPFNNTSKIKATSKIK